MGPSPGRGVKYRGLGLGPSPGHDQPSAAMSWAKPVARPRDEDVFAQSGHISRSVSAPNRLVGMLMKNLSHKDDDTAMAASTQAESAASPWPNPRSSATARATAPQIDYNLANNDQGGPRLGGGMAKGKPEATAPVIIAGSTQPADSETERSAHSIALALENHHLCRIIQCRRFWHGEFSVEYFSRIQ